MKSIKYTHINEGMTVSPHYTRDVQEGTRQRFEALLQALTGGTSQVVVLHGCEVTHSSNHYRMTAGAVYYNGDLYSVPAFPNTEASGGQVPVFVVDEQFTANALHGDNAFRPTFFNKQMKLQIGAPGSGIANHDGVVKLEHKISEFIGVATQIQTAVSALQRTVDEQLAGKADTNDPRLPTTDEKAALAGARGVARRKPPGGSNEYVTEDDPRLSNERVPIKGSVRRAKIAHNAVNGEKIDIGSILPIHTSGGVLKNVPINGETTNSFAHRIAHAFISGTYQMLPASAGIAGDIYAERNRSYIKKADGVWNRTDN